MPTSLHLGDRVTHPDFAGTATIVGLYYDPPVHAEPQADFRFDNGDLYCEPLSTLVHALLVGDEVTGSGVFAGTALIVEDLGSGDYRVALDNGDEYELSGEALTVTQRIS